MNRNLQASIAPLSYISIPKLDEKSVATYFSLIARAQHACLSYNGSHARRVHLFKTFERVRNFATGCQQPGQSIPDVIHTLSSQSPRYQSSYFNLEEFYNQARLRVRGECDQPSDYGFIDRVSCAAQKGFKKNKKFPVTGDIPFSSGNASYQPKLSALIDELCAHDLGLEFISINTGPCATLQDLQNSYIILRITGLTIAVCDHEAAPTYMGRTTSRKDFWKDPAFTKVETSDISELCRALREKILFADDNDRPTPPPTSLTSAQKLHEGLNHLIQKRRILPKFSDGAPAGEFMKAWFRLVIENYESDHYIYPRDDSGNVAGFFPATFLMISDALYAYKREPMTLTTFIDREFKDGKNRPLSLPTPS